MLGELVRAVLERAPESELTVHLGYDRAGAEGRAAATPATGIAKTVQTGVGPVPLQVPRDRAGTFEPVLVPKRSGRVAGGLDDMVISLYAHGMSVRDIIHYLRQVYGTELSPETVSQITDQVRRFRRTRTLSSAARHAPRFRLMAFAWVRPPQLSGVEALGERRAVAAGCGVVGTWVGAGCRVSRGRPTTALGLGFLRRRSG
jgi:hypothetical protein